MTTREATSLLPRANAEIIGDYARSVSEWAAVIGFGAVQWPWLLRGLHGGTLAEKHALLDRLELPRDALPNLGSWKADTGLLKQLVDHIEARSPRLVVEFGTGASTLVLARAMQRAGGASVLLDDQVTADTLAGRIEDLVGFEERLRAMSEASARFGKPTAAEALADLVLETAR